MKNNILISILALIIFVFGCNISVFGQTNTGRQRTIDESTRDRLLQEYLDKQDEAEQEKLENQAKNLRLPVKLGSFSVLISGIKSNSGDVMLLGCPQMGEPSPNEPQINNEVELLCPTLHVGGMTIAGVPSVIIGHNEYHAWTLTSGYSDNSDVYIDSTLDNSYSKYYYDGEWLDFKVIQDTISSGGSNIEFTHYRTLHQQRRR